METPSAGARNPLRAWRRRGRRLACPSPCKSCLARGSVRRPKGRETAPPSPIEGGGASPRPAAANEGAARPLRRRARFAGERARLLGLLRGLLVVGEELLETDV